MQWAAIEQEVAIPGNMSHLTDPMRLQVLVPPIKLASATWPPCIVNEFTLDDLRSFRRNCRPRCRQGSVGRSPTVNTFKFRPVAANL